MAVYTVTLSYPESANRIWRSNPNNRNTPYKTQLAKDYCNHAGWLVRAAGINEPLEGDIAVTIRLYRPRKSGDLDNRIKLPLDAMQGTAYHNDNQIVEIHAYRYDDKHNPRVEIDIMEVE